MAKQCQQCGKTLGLSSGGEICYACRIEAEREQTLEAEREQALEAEREQALEGKLAGIVLTTETVIDFKITRRLEVITAECVFGMNIFRDIFAGIRDIAGGRSVATQKVLRDSRKTVLYELRKEAHSVGANAVVGVDLDYSEFSGGGKSMLFLVASGTAVVADLPDTKA
ncbi:MAG: YbjQ family protein [Gammaproteobacteria bacterium]